LGELVHDAAFLGLGLDTDSTDNAEKLGLEQHAGDPAVVFGVGQQLPADTPVRAVPGT
jgi:hypothetical protein